MDWWLYFYIFTNLILITFTTNIGPIRTLDAQQDERVRLECTVTSKLDAEEAMWMRIRSSSNPDILTYRDNVVYSPDRIQLEQRRLSSSINSNGTFVDTYFLTLTILRPNIDDEGRYICSRRQNVFAEYDLYIIVPPQFIDDNSFIHQRTVIEGSSLQLSCSADGRPKPSITWFYRTTAGKHISLTDGTGCQDKICELRLGNYSRHDPTIIECIADNEKSTRISKAFNIDVYYPPKIITNTRTFTGSRSIDVLLECTSISNPSPSIIWLDDNKQEINNTDIYNIKTINQSSSISFSVFPQGHTSVIFYCRSNNSVGTDEKLIDISNFIQFDSIIIHETTPPVISVSSSVAINNNSSPKKQKTLRPNRARSRSSTTIILRTSTSQISSSSNSLINFHFLCHLFCIILSFLF